MVMAFRYILEQPYRRYITLNCGVGRVNFKFIGCLPLCFVFNIHFEFEDRALEKEQVH